MKSPSSTNPSFEDLIKDNCLYVDKTRYLYSMISSNDNYFFCSRPRRFGKTLTVYTLEAIFKGQRELFKGLYIDSTDYDWKEYPVIHIDIGSIQATEAGELRKSIRNAMREIALDYGIGGSIDFNMEYYDVFKSLIKTLSKKEKVVILIDEYDKLLSSNIFNPEISNIRDVLRGFFEVIKATAPYVRFVFITGVTKYAKVSIFSSMNNLNDISMDLEYSTMLGYTKDELLHYFSEHIDKGVMDTGMPYDEYLMRIKRQYDGYRFCEDAETVYNPVSIGFFFSKGGYKFDNYWSDTGGMKLLMDLSKKVDFHISDDLNMPIKKNDIRTFDILDISNGSADKITLMSLLFQTGYLTIRGSDRNGQVYYMDFPNGEVRESYSSSLLKNYLGQSAERKYIPVSILDYFEEGDVGEAMEEIRTIYSSIPYGNSDSRVSEKSYQDGFFCIMKGAGAEIINEKHTSLGRIDTVLKTREHIYIIEFKLDGTAEEAIGQIKEKRYYDEYNRPNREYKIHLLGINFSTELRNIESYKEEVL